MLRDAPKWSTPREEKAGKQQFELVTDFCYRLSDCRLPSTSGAVEPQYERIGVDLLCHPVEYLLPHGLSSVWMAFGGVEALKRVVKCARRCGRLKELHR